MKLTWTGDNYEDAVGRELADIRNKGFKYVEILPEHIFSGLLGLLLGTCGNDADRGIPGLAVIWQVYYRL